MKYLEWIILMLGRITVASFIALWFQTFLHIFWAIFIGVIVASLFEWSVKINQERAQTI